MRLKLTTAAMIVAASATLASAATASAAPEQRVTSLNATESVSAPEWEQANGNCAGEAYEGTSTVGANGLEITLPSGQPGYAFGGAEYNGVDGVPLEDLDALGYTEKYLQGAEDPPFLEINLVGGTEINWAPLYTATSYHAEPLVWQTWNAMEHGSTWNIDHNGLVQETWPEVIAKYGSEEMEDLQVQTGCATGSEGDSFVSVVQLGTSSGVHSGVTTFNFGEGTPGVEGPTGPEGKEGSTGPEGKEGKAGTEGKEGKAGTEGKEGKAGTEGKTGAAGPEGKTGAAGPEGKTGAAGPEGKTAKGEVLAAKEASGFGIASLDTKAIAKSGAKVSKGRVSLTLSCAGAKGTLCKGTVSLSGSGGSAKATFSIAVGKTGKVALKLPKALLAAVEKAGAKGLKAKVTVSSTTSGKKAVSKQASVKLVA